MTSKNKEIAIINGPSKFDLMTNLFGNQSNRGTVTFTISDGPKINSNYEVLIDMMGREDNSGDSWLVEGSHYTNGRVQNIKGWYSSQSRKGYFEII